MAKAVDCGSSSEAADVLVPGSSVRALLLEAAGDAGELGRGQPGPVCDQQVARSEK
jgi:hypothetical protein